MTTISPFSTALQYLQRGWSVFPCKGKIPCVDWDAFKKTRPSEDQVKQWMEEFPDANIAIALGRVSNLIRIDAEGPVPYERFELPPTLQFKTRNGFGWLYRYFDGVNTEVAWKGEGKHEELRIQSNGAYTIIPPSIHPDGGSYEWVNNQDPAKIPQWVKDRALDRMLRDLVREIRPTLRQPEEHEVIQALDYISPDDYDTWLQVGMSLKSGGEHYLKLWNDWSQRSDKFVEGECEKKWVTFRDPGQGGLTLRSIFYFAEKCGDYKPPNRHEPVTDLGFARVLTRMGEGEIKHSEKWGWLHWDGKRWNTEGAVKHVQELQKKALEYRMQRAVESLARHLTSDQNAPDYATRLKQKNNLITNLRKHEDNTHIKGARALAESEPTISIDYRLFNHKPYIFNAQNVSYDAENDEVREFQWEDYLTQISPTYLNMNSICPVFCSFLRDILPDEEVRLFIQKFFGTCITGDVSPQILPVFWGIGKNGKSTLIETIMHVLGDDYSMKGKRDMLMSKRFSDHPTSIARLYGKRFVACVETNETGKLDEGLVKELTGGDTIAARRMREDEWEFTPTHKVVLVTNHQPEVTGTDEGIWRRVALVPFEIVIPENKRDYSLKEKLFAEAPGILHWMIEGCRMWMRDGKKMTLPKSVQVASQQYRQEQDKLGSFISDRCKTGKGCRERIEKLVEAYGAWCSVNRFPQLNGNAFGRALTERGYPLEAQGSKYRINIEVIK